jgi:glycosyltransferase involved in cell wall biosynthesis
MIKVGIECENIEDPKSRWGVGQVTFNLLKEYVNNAEWQNKFELYLYFKKRIPDDDIFKIYASKFKIHVLGIPSFNIFYHILLPLKAMSDRLDWMFFPAYQLPPLYFGKSVVMLTPDVYFEYKYGRLPFRYRLSYRIFTNWAARYATKILAISETSRKELPRLYKMDPAKIFVSYLGVGSSFAKSAEGLLKEEGSYILYVGQMFPRRHAKDTILAFKKIAHEFPELKLIMVGKDKYSPPIIGELIKDVNRELGSERIFHHDYIEKREDIDKLYAGAGAFVYVSDREAFGLPPMEALSFGVPPVILDNELGYELFEDYAFYAKSGEPDDIAEAIKETMRNEQKAMKIRKEGPEFVNKYSWKSFAERLFKEIEK